jgi:hypothetical protein
MAQSQGPSDENELSSLTRQCVGKRRIGFKEALQSEITAWSSDVNDTQRGVDWQMKNRRCSLKAPVYLPQN